MLEITFPDLQLKKNEPFKLLYNALLWDNTKLENRPFPVSKCLILIVIMAGFFLLCGNFYGYFVA